MKSVLFFARRLVRWSSELTMDGAARTVFLMRGIPLSATLEDVQGYFGSMRGVSTITVEKLFSTRNFKMAVLGIDKKSDYYRTFKEPYLFNSKSLVFGRVEFLPEAALKKILSVLRVDLRNSRFGFVPGNDPFDRLTSLDASRIAFIDFVSNTFPETRLVNKFCSVSCSYDPDKYYWFINHRLSSNEPFLNNNHLRNSEERIKAQLALNAVKASNMYVHEAVPSLSECIDIYEKYVNFLHTIEKQFDVYLDEHPFLQSNFPVGIVNNPTLLLTNCNKNCDFDKIEAEILALPVSVNAVRMVNLDYTKSFHLKNIRILVHPSSPQDYHDLLLMHGHSAQGALKGAFFMPYVQVQHRLFSNTWHYTSKFSSCVFDYTHYLDKLVINNLPMQKVTGEGIFSVTPADIHRFLINQHSANKSTNNRNVFLADEDVSCGVKNIEVFRVSNFMSSVTAVLHYDDCKAAQLAQFCTGAYIGSQMSVDNNSVHYQDRKNENFDSAQHKNISINYDIVKNRKAVQMSFKKGKISRTRVFENIPSVLQLNNFRIYNSSTYDNARHRRMFFANTVYRDESTDVQVSEYATKSSKAFLKNYIGTFSDNFEMPQVVVSDFSDKVKQEIVSLTFKNNNIPKKVLDERKFFSYHGVGMFMYGQNVLRDSYYESRDGNFFDMSKTLFIYFLSKNVTVDDVKALLNATRNDDDASKKKLFDEVYLISSFQGKNVPKSSQIAVVAFNNYAQIRHFIENRELLYSHINDNVAYFYSGMPSMMTTKVDMYRLYAVGLPASADIRYCAEYFNSEGLNYVERSGEGHFLYLRAKSYSDFTRYNGMVNEDSGQQMFIMYYAETGSLLPYVRIDNVEESTSMNELLSLFKINFADWIKLNKPRFEGSSSFLVRCTSYEVRNIMRQNRFNYRGRLLMMELVFQDEVENKYKDDYDIQYFAATFRH